MAHQHPPKQMPAQGLASGNLPQSGAMPGVPDELIHLYALAVDSTHTITAPNNDVSMTELSQLNGLVKSLIATNDNPQQLPPGIPPQFIMQEYIPPPPQPIPNIRSNHIAKAKEDGNVAFRSQKWADAIRLYSISAALSATRPIFESSQYSRDELSIALCNRSAAYAADGQWIEALVDANAVIQLKKNWTKGYFRKGKALAGLGWYLEAKDAILLGLEFEPANEDLATALDEIEKSMHASKKSV